MKKFSINDEIDWILVTVTLALSLFGVVMIYSATQHMDNNIFWIKQAIYIGCGTLAGIFFGFIDYQLLSRYSKLIYAITCILLLLVLFMPPIRDARSWFFLGQISFQPAELAKLSVIIILADYLSRRIGEINSTKALLLPLLLVAIPLVLILKQPDLGTGLVFLPILLVLLYLSDIRLFYLISLIATMGLTTILILFLAWASLQSTIESPLNYFYKIMSSPKNIFLSLGVMSLIGIIIYGLCTLKKWHMRIAFPFFTILIIGVSMIGAYTVDSSLRDYQRKRLIVFFDPSVDPLGAGYNIIQSKIAIGSGQFIGKGFLGGTQSQLGFLPAMHTDFIFSVIAEEFGFVGGSILIGLFILLIYRGLTIAYLCNDPFGRLLAIGIVGMITIQVFFNIGIAEGLLPVTGLTLPLISYGGSSIFFIFISIGILNSIKRKKMFI